jgi:hypothetical protein
MADDSLGLMFTVDADASQADAKTAEFLDQYNRRLDAVNAIMQKNAQISGETANAIVDGWEKQESAARAAAEAEREAAEAERAAEEEAERLGTGVGNLTGSFTENRIAAQGLAYDLGIPLPRAATTFIAEIGGIGPAMALAFAPIAVIGFIEALRRVPVEYDKLIGAVTGWNEAAKKAYTEELSENEKYIALLEKTLNLQHQMAGLKGSDLIKANIVDKNNEVKAALAVVNALEKERDARIESNKHVPLPEMIKPLDDITEAMAKAQKKANDLGYELAELEKLKLPTQQLDEFNEHMKIGEEAARQYAEAQKSAANKAAEAAKHQAELFQQMEDKYANFQRTVRDIADQNDKIMAAAVEKERKEAEQAADEQVKLNARRAASTDEMWNRYAAAQDRAMTESTRQLEEGFRTMASLEAKNANDQLQLVTKQIQDELKMKKIGHGQAASEEQAALNQWIAQRTAAIDSELKMVEASAGKESAIYRQLIEEKAALGDEAAKKQLQINLTESKSFQDYASMAMSALDSLSAAHIKNHGVEVAIMVSKAALKAIEFSYEAYGAFAAQDYVGGALYLAAAAEAATLGGGGAAGGGGGSSGGSGSGAGKSGGIQPNVYGGNSPVKASGALPISGNVTIAIMGTSEAGQWMATQINSAVTGQGAKLNATHNAQNQGL